MSSPGSKTYRSRLTMIIVSNSKHSQTIRINCVSGPKQERLIKLYRCKKQTNIQVTFEGMFKKKTSLIVNYCLDLNTVIASSVLKYNLEVLVLYWSISIATFFTFFTLHFL